MYRTQNKNMFIFFILTGNFYVLIFFKLNNYKISNVKNTYKFFRKEYDSSKSKNKYERRTYPYQFVK